MKKFDANRHEILQSIKVKQAVGARSSKLSKILNLVMNTDLHSSLFDLVRDRDSEKELRRLRMSADFFANTSHNISRCPGSVKCYCIFMGCNCKYGQNLSKKSHNVLKAFLKLELHWNQYYLTIALELYYNNGNFWCGSNWFWILLQKEIGSILSNTY